MTNTTVHQHIENSRALVKTISDANALVIKLQGQLAECRRTLEILGEWAHPKMEIGPLYGTAFKDKKAATGKVIVAMQIAMINEVLGDRA